MIQAHVQKRKRTALFINCGTLVGTKAHVLIETHGLRILLVDRHFFNTIIGANYKFQCP